MRKKMSRLIAGILFACMVAGSIPAEAVYGADNAAGNSQESEQNQSGAAGNTTVTDEEQLPGGNEEMQDDAADNDQKTEEEASEEPEGIFIDNEESDVSGNENDISPASDGDSAAEATAGEAEEAERAEINFVYIESPYLETPGTQRIVFSFDREITESESVTLTVEDETGIQEEWGLAQRTDHLYLFEKEYTGDSYTGTYHAVSLNFHDGQNDSIILEDAGVEAEFGVNEKYDGIEELQPVDDSAVTEAEQSQVEASVVTIDENGVAQAQDSIADALNAVSAQNASVNGISMFSADVSSGARTARAGDIVVALDPGHDANDAGAQGFGLREEDLTLKIANYCKEELEQYSGVSVYMTRTTAACPYNCTSAGSCIAQRAQAAAAAGAQIFVSFHLNASVSSSANGAEIIVPNYNWKYEVGAQGHALAEKILTELTALGLTNRGIYSKDTTINERYPDGSLSDYFSVMIYNKENGIPGIIVEHAFISNSGDVNRFLTTETGLKQLGVADATGIANYLGLSKGRWETDSDGNTYYYEEGQKVYGEKKIGTSWYYFDPDNNGAMVTGWKIFNSRKVYYKSSGEMAMGELKIDGDWYFFSSSNGGMVTGWHDFANRRVYYDSEGKMVTGQKQIDGKWYLFSTSNGGMVTGWYDYGNRLVYYKSSGEMATGELKIDGSWYLFSTSNGAMQTGWQTLGNRKVYYKPTGEMVTGEYKLDGYWYLFNTGNGGMVTGWHDYASRKVYYDEDGRMVTGELEIEGEWYLFKTSNGGMVTGWYEDGDRKVYYMPTGERAEGEQKIDGNWYCFNSEDGSMVIGFWKLGNRTVYYNSSGFMVTGEQKIDGSWYLFSTGNGAMVTGWYDYASRRVYYDEDGRMLTGEQEIEGKLYYFKTSNGDMIRSEWVNGKYFGEDGCYVGDANTELYEIEGSSTLTVDQMVSMYKDIADKNDFTYPSEELKKGGASSIESFCQIYFEEANAEGIKVEVAFAQAIHETGWLQFGGDVKIEQFNFAGIGATGGGAQGASFPDVRTGIRAHIQHLKAYASEAPLNNEKVDPRFDYVTRNSAPYVEWLGQKENPTGAGWATATGYGYRVKEIILQLFKY